MPTKKPVVQTVLDETLYLKFTKIAEMEKRSKSQLTAIAIEKYIKEYENSNGKVIKNLSASKIG